MVQFKMLTKDFAIKLVVSLSNFESIYRNIRKEQWLTAILEHGAEAKNLQFFYLSVN